MGRRRHDDRPGLPTTSATPEQTLPREGLGASCHLVWIIAFLLTAFGLLMIYSVSTGQGFFSESPVARARLTSQGMAAALGIVAMLILSRLDYRRLRKAIVLGFFLSLALLLATRVPGLGVKGNGAARWLSLGPLTVQPSELAKLAYVCLAAHLLSTPRASKGRPSALFWPLAPLLCVGGGLILWQPDLGTAFIVVVVVFGSWWQAGMPLRYWLSALLIGVLALSVAILCSDYRRERFLSFVDPLRDPQGDGFQVLQSFVALARGGWLGVGPGRSIQKFQYLPEAHSDMIFSIAAEEFGFVGMALLVFAFGALVITIFRVAGTSRDPFGRLLASGVGIMVAAQTVVNLGGVTGVLPLTGVPLPFISYGRTNLIVMLAGVGLVLAVGRYGSRALLSTRSCPSHDHGAESEALDNVAHLDLRRRYGRAHRAGAGRS